MPRAWFSSAAPCLVAVLGLALCGNGCSAPEPMPHVVLVTVDTLRPDYMSMNGYPRPTTPRLDALLAEGSYFEHAVSPIPRTTPALASLLTGSYPHTTRLRTLSDSLPLDVVTLTQVLGGAGYRTSAVVTNHVLSPERGLGRGFETYDMARDGRSGASTTDVALASIDPFLPDAAAGAPVFLWVHYIDPHVPYHPEARHAEAMDPGYEGRYASHFGWQRQSGQHPMAQRPFPKELPKKIAVHRNPLADEVNRHIRLLYAADIATVDVQIGRLMDGIRARLGENVLLIFSADHGESLGEHEFFWDHGDYVYQAGTRVPLAFVLPESHPLHGGRRCDGQVSLVDVAPTLLDLIGVQPPPEMARRMDGRSLSACMRGEPLASQPAFMESGSPAYPELVARLQRGDVAGRFRAVVLDGWKLIWTPFLEDEQAWQLFDLSADPDEERDLFRSDHPMAIRLRPLLEEWAAREPPSRETPELTPQDEKALRELGYLE